LTSKEQAENFVQLLAANVGSVNAEAAIVEESTDPASPPVLV
jgi:hypothetical protein